MLMPFRKNSKLCQLSTICFILTKLINHEKNHPLETHLLIIFSISVEILCSYTNPNLYEHSVCIDYPYLLFMIKNMVYIVQDTQNLCIFLTKSKSKLDIDQSI